MRNVCFILLSPWKSSETRTYTIFMFLMSFVKCIQKNNQLIDYSHCFFAVHLATAAHTTAVSAAMCWAGGTSTTTRVTGSRPSSRRSRSSASSGRRWSRESSTPSVANLRSSYSATMHSQTVIWAPANLSQNHSAGMTTAQRSTFKCFLASWTEWLLAGSAGPATILPVSRSNDHLMAPRRGY